MQPRESMIEEYVKRFERNFGDDAPYRQGLEYMNGLSLQTITPEDVASVVEPFLFAFGRMGRVLGRREYEGWQTKVANAIGANYQRLGYLRTIDVEEADLAQYEPDVKNCYEAFKEAVGPVAAAKTLHLICPDFFPLWDTAIAQSAVQERPPSTWGKAPYRWEDYYMFCQQTQAFIRRHSEIIAGLSHQYAKSKVRITDECLWMATHRPLLHLLQETDVASTT